MKKIWAFLLTVGLLLTSCNKTPEPLDLIYKSPLSNAKDFHIVWTFFNKSAMSSDTSSSQASAWVTYKENDTNWHADIIVQNEQGNTGIYYNGQGYEYNPRANAIILYPKKYAKYAAYLNNSDFILYITKPDKLKQLIEDTLNKASVLDTMFNNHKAWALKIQLPDNSDMHNRSLTFYFDHKNYHLLGMENKSFIIWGWSWNSVVIDSFTTNTDPNYIAQTLAKLQQTTKMDTLKLNEGEEKFKLLKIGSLAPEIYGHIYQTKDTFLLSEQNAKLYIIDFWYQTCHPCMKAIPYLVNLYNNYKDKGLLVIGVNSVDNNQQRYSYIKKFIEFKQITYPIIMTERKVDMSYKVPGYPTLYVLDKNKHIIYIEVGFDPNKKLNAIDSIVKSRLQ